MSSKRIVAEKLFQIYRSSAGSGKTRTLAKAYLSLALQFRADYFRYILAVTFANKATQEMKDRILMYLDKFANNIPDDLAEELKLELSLDDATFAQHAHAIQSAILHQYSQFSISTIDAFFQKVIRSFTREAGLLGDYRLEVDQELILEEVVDNLIDELGSNPELTSWVVDYARENLENERAWDVRLSLIEFAKEIFKDEFKDIEDVVNQKTSDRNFFKDLRKRLWAEKKSYQSSMQKLASEALSIMRSNNLTGDDIKHGANSGLFTFFEYFASQSSLKKASVKPRVRNTFTEASQWPSPKSPRKASIIALAESKLVPIINEMLDMFDKRHKAALSAEIALENLYTFGLIADISRKLKEYKDENNVMLLADAPKFLNGIIQDSDTPFIYEKVGSFYRNYLIDEFQDTSGMQWKNFLPLLLNSLDQGNKSLVVGDVKQAIYRWRGGDLNLLQQEVEKHVGSVRTDVQMLNSNYRSSSRVVNFNNNIFKTASEFVSLENDHPITLAAYNDVSQKIFHSDEGFVKVRFYDDDPDENWKVKAMDAIPHHLEELQRMGIPLKDIAILVRKNDEGQEIVAHLLQYKNSEMAVPGLRYDVVSNESLQIDGASTVNLLVSALQYLLNPDNIIARAQMGYEFARLHEPGRPLTDVFAVANQVFFESNLPPAFAREKASLKKLPLFELTETLIEIFDLGKEKGELAYLQAFQNLVLEFAKRERNDIGAFLDWWEINKRKESIKISGDVDAVEILTIHKSKGLQFKYVLIPFCSWNMDHDNFRAPTLWVSSDEPPFNDAGYLPVKYTSTLNNTCFSEYYNAERKKSLLDNLNLLYVALTRAEKGMIISAPVPEGRMKKSVADLLYRGIELSPLVENWNSNAKEFSCGQFTASPAKQESANKGMTTLGEYSSFPWREKLVIRQTANAYFNPPDQSKHEKMNVGIHLHTILSRIRYAHELPDALEILVLEGLITTDEKPVLTEQLEALFKNSQIANWFSSAWEVKTEVPILLPDGSENRIDRLLIKDRHAVIIDFKTGEPAKSDQRQIESYITILHKMNYYPVEGYLLYVRQHQILSVGGGKTRMSKRKDESQISLDF